MFQYKWRLLSLLVLFALLVVVVKGLHRFGLIHVPIILSAEDKTAIPERLTKQVFPPDNPWNQDISNAPVDPHSDAILATTQPQRSLHPDFGGSYMGAPNGIPYIVVSGNEPKSSVTFSYKGESDPGPYPIPPNPPIEGGPNGTGDRHVLIIDKDNWILYELFEFKDTGAGYTADSGAIFDMKSNRMRPAGWTSADAAGLPIFPGLVRYDEVVQDKVINHALRFTVAHTQKAYIFPARHFASNRTDPNLPPMGMRVRLKSSVDISHYSPEAQVILTALKKYGMILADNGSSWFLSGAPDDRWNDMALADIKHIKGTDFEVIQMDTPTTR